MQSVARNATSYTDFGGWSWAVVSGRDFHAGRNGKNLPYIVLHYDSYCQESRRENSDLYEHPKLVFKVAAKLKNSLAIMMVIYRTI